ncbi:MAG: GNAT family N-acetyltransferase [Lachnospiraceae bacterium]|nr:GNAT family N-acetyltransferase [Lachnospiraceae bacterium]MBR4573776.1 GNAT family N-acetyltransferase [Lachnospiraceae bacterium]
MIREVKYDDLQSLLELYLHLHDKSVPAHDETLKRTWEKILSDENYHLIVCEEDGRIVSSCTCLIVPNLTRTVRPYALIENVVTHPDYRKKGCAGGCLSFARKIADENNCYKMMLMTGSKDPAIHRFYEKNGYSSKDKTAYALWINMDY